MSYIRFGVSGQFSFVEEIELHQQTTILVLEAFFWVPDAVSVLRELRIARIEFECLNLASGSASRPSHHPSQQ
jgi:hypothetical protein